VSIPDYFRASLTFIHPRDIAEIVKDNRWRRGGEAIELQNEIWPTSIAISVRDLVSRTARKTGVGSMHSPSD
jgi:hypothetical protein